MGGKTFGSLILCIASMSLAASCFAQTSVGGRPPYRPHPALPECPNAHNSHKWADYFAGHYPGRNPNKMFSIYFDKMDGKSDAGWGELHKGQCLRAAFTTKAPEGNYCARTGPIELVRT
jgi:hypothetical protein